MLVRLSDDVDEWAAREPEDGLVDEDEDEDEKEAAYAAEALQRLAETVGGDKVATLLLPQLQSMVGGEEVPWQSRHAALVAIGTVCEFAPSVIEPHLASLVGMLGACGSTTSPRLRWAGFYCLGLLCDNFTRLAESHDTLMPLIIGGLGDKVSRVQAAAALAVVNWAHKMGEETTLLYMQPLLTAAHSLLAAPQTAGYVAYTLASMLSQVATELGDAMGSAYSAFMPILRERFRVALDGKEFKLAASLLQAQGNLIEAAGIEHFRADAEAMLPPLVQMVAQQDLNVTCRPTTAHRPHAHSIAPVAHPNLVALSPPREAALVPPRRRVSRPWSAQPASHGDPLA